MIIHLFYLLFIGKLKLITAQTNWYHWC